MNVLTRTYYCPSCRKFTRLTLPSEQRSCGHCGKSLISPGGLYREDDFSNTDNPEVIGNWLKVTRTRYFGLRERTPANGNLSKEGDTRRMECKIHGCEMSKETGGWLVEEMWICPKCARGKVQLATRGGKSSAWKKK